VTIAAGRTPILEQSVDNMRVALERRRSYALAEHTQHIDFGRYFTNGLVDGVPMRIQTLGELNVPTGRIVAADPFYVAKDFTRPFERRVAPGRYPVIASLADLAGWGERVAFVMLKLSPAAPASWHLAETTLPEHVFRSHYGVDAGLGLFADLASAELFARMQRECATSHPQGNYYDDVLARCFEAHDNWCEHRPDPASDLNVIIFSSGLGDGLYPSYWGLTASGVPVCLVTDFQLFDREGTILQADAFAKRAIITKSILEQGKPVAYLYRETPDHEGDSGWRLTGGEGEEYLDDAANLRLVSLRELARLDPALKDLLTRPIGSAFRRSDDGKEFVVAEGPVATD
jgi:hypothetical protein